MAEQTEQERIIDLARGIPYGWLTTVDAAGRLVARPMSPREVGDDGVIWFFAERSSRDAAEISANANVGVTLQSGSTFVSFAGVAELVDDAAKRSCGMPRSRRGCPTGRRAPRRSSSR